MIPHFENRMIKSIKFVLNEPENLDKLTKLLQFYEGYNISLISKGTNKDTQKPYLIWMLTSKKEDGITDCVFIQVPTELAAQIENEDKYGSD